MKPTFSAIQTWGFVGLANRTQITFVPPYFRKCGENISVLVSVQFALRRPIFSTLGCILRTRVSCSILLSSSRYFLFTSCLHNTPFSNLISNHHLSLPQLSNSIMTLDDWWCSHQRENNWKTSTAPSQLRVARISNTTSNVSPDLKAITMSVSSKSSMVSKSLEHSPCAS